MRFNLSLFSEIKKNIYVLKKKHWSYESVEDFQLECLAFVKENPEIVLLIFCNHPHCFTMGKGLQKLAPSQGVRLIDFNPATPLDFPLYTLKRGGGLTFHYPGQLVFYPILNLTYYHLNVYDLMISILNIIKSALFFQFNLESLEVEKTLLGLWHYDGNEKFKIASIGLAVSRYITYHGLALNIKKDILMFTHLKKINPCGLTGNIYKSLEDILKNEINENTVDVLTKKIEILFVEYLTNQGMIERQRSSSAIITEISS